MIAMTTTSLLCNPGPAETPGSNDRRVGAPNHHQHTGSGGTTMVGTILAADQDTTDPDAATAQFVQDRLAGQTHRFLTADAAGLRVHLADLAELVTEILGEYADHVVAERDALAEDLAYEMNARGGVQHAGVQVGGA